MNVYTRVNGKRQTIQTPRDLMNLRAEGTTVFVSGDTEGDDFARWNISILHFIKRGGTVRGIRS